MASEVEQPSGGSKPAKREAKPATPKRAKPPKAVRTRKRPDAEPRPKR